jgi:hypothetical protein
MFARHPKIARRWADEEKSMPNPMPTTKPGKRDKMYPKGGSIFSGRKFGPSDKAAFQYSRKKKRR